MEEKYRSLDEEIAGKTKKMKKLFGMLQSAKGEVDAIQRERREQVPHRCSTVCLPPVLRGGGAPADGRDARLDQGAQHRAEAVHAHHRFVRSA